MIKKNTFKAYFYLLMAFIFSLITNPLRAEMKQYYSPAKSLHGDWSLIDMQLDGDLPKEILKTRVIHNPGEKTAKSNILITDQNSLGKTVKGEQFEIVHFITKDHKDTYLSIAFKTSKGRYSAKLAYHPIDFDERVESWRGNLYLEGKAVAFVALDVDDSNTQHPYQGEHSYEESLIIAQADQANTTPIGKLQGNWRLVSDGSDGQLLLKAQIIHNKDTMKAEGGFIAHEESYLGKVKSGSILTINQQGKILNISFKTDKGHYTASLLKDSKKYTNLPGYAEIWAGTISFPNKTSAPVYFGKQAEPIQVTAKKKPKSNLYDLNDPNNEFIFTCKKEKCSYDYIDGNVISKGIPLLKNWAITEPFYYATAGAGQSKLPIIDFINIKNGLWITLNPRIADPKIVSCVEFGKNGRLSDEERVCYVTEEVENTSSNMITLLENIEFWREQSYQK